MRVKIKICGMSDADNIREVAALRPDYLGFIFHPASPRFVGDNFQLPRGEVTSVNRVGVFVNSPIDVIQKKFYDLDFDYIQLHGDESPEFCRELKEKGIKTIKSFSIDASFDFDTTKIYSQVADYFLFDTKGKHAGGNGIAFDWSLLKKYDQSVPFFLSGGLGLQHIERLKELNGMNIHAIDLNSGVESKPGMKDVEKVNEIHKAIK